MIKTDSAFVISSEAKTMIQGIFNGDITLGFKAAPQGAVLPTVKRVGRTYTVTGKGLTSFYTTTDFPVMTGTGKVLEVKLPSACPAGTITVKQTNPALVYCGYEDGIREMTYTLAQAADYEFLLCEGKGEAEIVMTWTESEVQKSKTFVIKYDLEFAA